MADSVEKLKSLLFQQETATLVDLEHRIERVDEAEQRARAQIAESLRQLEAIRQLGAESRRLQAEVERRLAELDKRAGSAEALKMSVAEVIDDVIVEARKTKQDDLSRALAPMLVKTIKAELKNNQAEMVEALYPITGQLVKSYVASAMRDLTNRMNRGIETSGFMLRLRSVFSGYSKAELQLAETQRLEVEELYLLRRGSGELLLRFPESLARGGDAQHMSGVLAAINEFAANAFLEDGGNLRSFDVDDFTLFLRASPTYLLAAKCRGVAAPGVESLIDSEFLATVPELHRLDDGGLHSAMPARLMADLKTRVESGIADKHDELSRAGLPFRPMRVLTATAAMALLAAGGWYAWTSWEVESTREAARRVITGSEAMSGYPVTLEVGPRGRTIAVLGLAPTEAAKSKLMTQLATELPGVVIEDKGLAALPGRGPDVTPAIEAVRRDLGTVEATVRRDLGGMETTLRRDIGGVEGKLRRDLDALERQTVRAAAVRSLDRARLRLEEALPDLGTLAGLQDTNRRSAVAAVQKVVETVAAGIATQTTALGSANVDAVQDARAGEALQGAIAQLRKAAMELSGLIGQRPLQEGPAPVSRRTGGDLSDIAETAALSAERLATVSAAALQAASIRIPEPPRIVPPSALERLRDYAARHAIFFSNNDDFRDPAAADRVIAGLAALAKDAGAIVRVVGYTDESGGQPRNNLIAQSRAEKVAQALVARGVAAQRIVAVGRAAGPDISPLKGPDSANRRVQFEIGLEGEPVSRP